MRETSNVPSGLLVRGDRDVLARAFGALVPLQPVEWDADGLLCAPDGLSTAAPFPTEPRPRPAVWPDSRAAYVAGWYRRSDCHAPAPPGVRELVQVPGTGFGPFDHPTTAMCLAALDHLPATDALDAGCGSGLLAQAWARLHHEVHVLAVDADAAAVAQARASMEASGLAGRVDVRRRQLETLSRQDIAGRVVFANVPPVAHRVLRGRIGSPPVALVASGFRPDEAGAILDGYRSLGLRRVRAMRRRRFECHVLVDDA